MSPNSKKLAYLSPVNNVVNIFIRSTFKDDDRTITDFKKRGIIFFHWASDKYIVYIQDKAGDENWHLYKLNVETGEIKTLTPYKDIKVRFFHCNTDKFPDQVIISMNKDNKAFYDLYHIDLHSNKVTLMKKNPGNIVEWLIDHSLTLRGIEVINDDGSSDIMIKEKGAHTWKNLFHWSIDDRPLCRISGFSKDNNYIYFIDSRELNTGSLVRININTRKRNIIFHDPHYDIYASSSSAGQWLSYNILFCPKTYEIQAVSYSKFRREWAILDEAIRKDIEAIKKIDRGDFFILERAKDDKLWLIKFESDNKPPSYYIFERKTKKEKLLYRALPDLDKYTMAEMKEVRLKSRDGLTLYGYITCPSGIEGKKSPLVLLVHRGPSGRDMWKFNPEVQWLVNRGYACLQINYRGSSGYGKFFLKAGYKEWGGKMQADLVDAVRWAVDNNIADPEKIAIYGAGYGGYAALAGAAFTPELFCCAVAIECPANLISFIRSIPDQLKVGWKRLLKSIGDPKEDKKLLTKRSPFYKLKKIKIPILIAYGLNSSRVRSSEIYEIIKNLRSRGMDIEQIVFPDEGHEITKAENRIKFYAMVEKFLSSHLRGQYEEEKLPQNDASTSPSNDRDKKSLVYKVYREGDRQAFENLLRHYEKPVLKHLFNLTDDAKISRELLYETFFRVWFYIESYSFNMPFSSWLFKIATNVARRYMKDKKKLYQEISLEDINQDILTGSEYEENITDKMLFESIVESLKVPYKTALIHRMKGMSYKEIASLMNTEPERVKKYIFRARQYFLESWTKSV